MKKTAKKGIIGRLIKTLFSFYPVLLPVTLALIVFNAVVSSFPSIFMQNIIAVVDENWETGSWQEVGGQILHYVIILAIFYILSLVAGIIFHQLMAVITQGVLKKMRQKMFTKMQRLPIKYFDANNHGDIMSHYTNDIDTLRQMISQSFPQILISGITVLTVFSIMLYFCLWLTIVVVFGVFLMTFVVKKLGGGSSKYFFRQQASLGKLEGYIEEMMNGQKVVKVFCHEEESKQAFDKLNDSLFSDSERANKYANALGPVLNNIGNIRYVIVAICGGILLPGCEGWGNLV